MKGLRLIVYSLVAAALTLTGIARAEGDVKPAITPKQAAQQRAAAAEAKKAEWEKKMAENKEKWDTKKAENKEKWDAKKAEIQAKIEARKAEWEKFMAARQKFQADRIQHGIDKGHLTDDEAAKLKSQQNTIASIIEAMKEDGRLKVDELKKIHQAFEQASRMIWAEKRDDQGNPMSVYALGKNIKLNPVVANMLADENLRREEARELAKDFHRILVIKHQLATAQMTDGQRDKLREEFAELLNKYFYKVD